MWYLILLTLITYNKQKLKPSIWSSYTMYSNRFLFYFKIYTVCIIFKQIIKRKLSMHTLCYNFFIVPVEREREKEVILLSTFMYQIKLKHTILCIVTTKLSYCCHSCPLL
jgi:hypothetical protein